MDAAGQVSGRHLIADDSKLSPLYASALLAGRGFHSFLARFDALHMQGAYSQRGASAAYSESPMSNRNTLSLLRCVTCRGGGGGRS
jgi:hypothetical protein